MAVNELIPRANPKDKVSLRTQCNVLVQLWFLLAIQNHNTIAAVCNRLATVSIPTRTRLLLLRSGQVLPC